MPATSMAESMSPELLKVMERAKDPKFVFLSLAHLIDEAALARAFHRIRKEAAVGVDGIPKEQYGQELESHVHDLYQRLRTMRWRHQPIRRVHIPKEKGKSRPIGISSVEDKIVQEALREILDTLYEPSSATSRTASGKGAARTTRFVPLTRCCVGGRECGSWSLTYSPTSTALSARCSWRCSGRGSSMGRFSGSSASVCTWVSSTVRSTSSRVGARRRDRCCRRYWATSTCTTCSTCGSSGTWYPDSEERRI